ITAPARPTITSRTEKSPKLPISQRLAQERCRSCRQPWFRAALPIWENNRGDSRGDPANPHTFLCTKGSGLPVPLDISRNARGFAPLVRDRVEAKPGLLQLDLGAGLFELGLDLLGLVLVHAFL